MLTSRSQPSDKALETINLIRAMGADIVVECGDIAAPGTAKRLVAAATATGLPLRGVLNVLAIWNRNSRWAHSLEADYGRQPGVVVADRSPRTIQWYGAAAASKYALGPKQYAAVKAEWYREDSGFLLDFRGSMTSLTLNTIFLNPAMSPTLRFLMLPADQCATCKETH